MKRLLLLTILVLLAPGVAEAQRGDRGDRREARVERAPDRAAFRAKPKAARERAPHADRRVQGREVRFDVAQARRNRDQRVKPPKRQPPGQARRLSDGKPLPPGQAKRQSDDRRFDRGPTRRGGYSRGHIMPQESRRARMEDYARHRLRRPPAGYSYYLRGRNAYLVSDRTGMIFEVVPIGG